MADDELRREFEEWARSFLDKDPGGCYIHTLTEAKWRSWKAAHASGYRAGMERAAVVCDELPAHGTPDHCAAAIREEIER